MPVVMSKCENCGLDFNNACGTGLCIPCELKVKAAEPTEALLDMRTIYQGEEPRTAAQKLLKALLEKEPNKFLDRLEKAEAEYRSKFSAPGGALESDDGQEKADELLEQLLEEANHDQGG